MLEIKGEYNTAKVFTDDIEEEAVAQIKEMCDMEYLKDCDIRIMPDVHAGKGCTIGTTIKIKDKVCPNYVGVDIGCGVMVCKFDTSDLDLKAVDEFINNNIPSGMNIYEERNFDNWFERYIYKEWEKLLDEIKAPIDKDRALKSIGTLGGGNHFIEISKTDDAYYLIIHTGSRHLGLEVAKYYQEQAYKQSNSNKPEVDVIIKELKDQGRENEIEQVLKDIKNNKKHFTKDNAYITGDLFYDYIHDIDIIQEYAHCNRSLIAHKILEFIGSDIHILECDTIHNYIDIETMILRKGSVRAKDGEKFILPLNMRDGSLLCVGKGNEDWNYSAPHGAGRLMSRTKAKQEINLEEYKKSMDGIYSTSVCEETLDESPMAYKNADSIRDNIHQTATIVEHIKPIYNFKAKS